MMPVGSRYLLKLPLLVSERTSFACPGNSPEQPEDGYER